MAGERRREDEQRSSIRPRNEPVTRSPLMPSVSMAMLYFEERGRLDFRAVRRVSEYGVKREPCWV